jgi:hypothetical protein
MDQLIRPRLRDIASLPERGVKPPRSGARLQRVIGSRPFEVKTSPEHTGPTKVDSTERDSSSVSSSPRTSGHEGSSETTSSLESSGSPRLAERGEKPASPTEQSVHPRTVIGSTRSKSLAAPVKAPGERAEQLRRIPRSRMPSAKSKLLVRQQRSIGPQSRLNISESGASRPVLNISESVVHQPALNTPQRSALQAELNASGSVALQTDSNISEESYIPVRDISVESYEHVRVVKAEVKANRKSKSLREKAATLIKGRRFNVDDLKTEEARQLFTRQETPLPTSNQISDDYEIEELSDIIKGKTTTNRNEPEAENDLEITFSPDEDTEQELPT